MLRPQRPPACLERKGVESNEGAVGRGNLEEVDVFKSTALDRIQAGKAG